MPQGSSLSLCLTAGFAWQGEPSPLAGRRAERTRDKEIPKRQLAELAACNPDILFFFLRENVDVFNAIPGEAEGLALLDRLLGAQPYRLAYWGVAADEINYRKIFDINDLAALQLEREEVFAATHELIGELMAHGRLTALSPVCVSFTARFSLLPPSRLRGGG